MGSILLLRVNMEIKNKEEPKKDQRQSCIAAKALVCAHGSCKEGQEHLALQMNSGMVLNRLPSDLAGLWQSECPAHLSPTCASHQLTLPGSCGLFSAGHSYCPFSLA
jgi:hypothetical protein